MTIHENIVSQLSAVRADLTARIISQTASPGTPEWQLMMLLVARRDLITAQINTVLVSTINEAQIGLAEAVNDLEKSTNELNTVQRTLQTTRDVIQITDTIMQAATVVIGFAA